MDNSAAFDDFARVTERAVYTPLPQDWWIGATDVVGSTEAIEAGRYKAVNMAGASAISAVMNAIGGAGFPFAFGGDGAQFAVPPEHEPAARDALARTVRWANDDLGLNLRAALIRHGDIMAAGHEVLLANYAPSQAVRYAMFAGGGMEWAEEQLKAGAFAVARAAPGKRPDLEGLSCRWKPISTRGGVMLSIIVRKPQGASEAAFFEAVHEVLELVDAQDRDGDPVPSEGPEFGPPWAGFDLEARAGGAEKPTLFSKLSLFAWRVVAWCIFAAGLRVGGFDPQRYRRQTARNSDFRKFHDGLHMTIDCSPEQADTIEAMLRGAQEKGAIRYGTFRQAEALMTCIVPSVMDDSHFHFVDGAGGGYAEAARRLKG